MDRGIDTPSTPNLEIDARMEEEEKKTKQKEQKKEIEKGPPTKLPGPFSCLLQPTWIMDISIQLWNLVNTRVMDSTGT